MKLNLGLQYLILSIVLGITLELTLCATKLAADESASQPSDHTETISVPLPSTTAEARARSKLLYETIRGSLQVMHRDFFDDEEAHAIPSASLQDVFDELAGVYSVEVKWLIVDTDVLNVDHLAENEFERLAVTALKSGKPHFESTAANRYRFAGPIRLASQCLKCHVKRRNSTETRTAGLLISMPLAAQTK
ncbi:DUF3365 domain-containing protein [Stieleria sp. TO1_6]|uniref:c-type heme family protein n=1 Tax=Stieleria tagensis TaxID=2956795 RepID=UPI00209B4081|nr:DUF3365 domain-containing protein [Stieleria tagensis]MCO8121692.1 DUF3365 domain-containing protein [Stieleria tagensis]